GVNHRLDGPYGSRPLVYADWTASGRLYGPIERRLAEEFGPLVGNTHSESSTTGMAMTRAYQRAQGLLKEHVHAGPDDVIITQAPGLPAVVNRLRRMLGSGSPSSWLRSASSRTTFDRWCSSHTWSTTPTRPPGWRPWRRWRSFRPTSAGRWTTPRWRR